MSKIVFLDFDGVMNSGNPDKWVEIDPYHVQFLNKITDATGASIVLTSSWRFFGAIDDLLLNAGVTAPIVGKIPDSTNRGRDGHYAFTRGAEIQTWISKNNVSQFVILDDLPVKFEHEDGSVSYFFEELKDHHVHCANREGLLDKHVDLAVNIMAKTEEIMKNTKETITEERLNIAFGVISGCLCDCAKELSDGMPGGSNPEWGYDRQLVLDIAQACHTWTSRQKEHERK
jgi:hypothetical protein